MITVSEALSKIREHAEKLGSEQVSITDAFNRTSANRVVAPFHVPGFRQSAMDGYAFSFSDYSDAGIVLKEESAAGDVLSTLEPQTSMRIFTGAVVPEGADTVVMQEHTRVEDGRLFIDPLPKQGANIRPIGSQTEEGEEILRPGDRLDAGRLGFLAGFGLADLEVVRKPRVSILTTGKELVAVGKPITDGGIYESNSHALKAALLEFGSAESVRCIQVPDEEHATIAAYREAKSQSDLVLFTGGVSVGDYDLVPRALQSEGAETIFHKIKQKPGKPLLFAKDEETIVFGLPGNPASVLTCFYMYVVPALQRMVGLNDSGLLSLQAPLKSMIKKKPGKRTFFKGVSVTGM